MLLAYAATCVFTPCRQIRDVPQHLFCKFVS